MDPVTQTTTTSSTSNQLAVLLTHGIKNWRSTTQSALTVMFMITGYLMVSQTIKPHTAIIMGTVNGICKLLIGWFETDGIQVPPGSTLQQTTKVTTPAAE